jgi:hypothetical protein
LKIVQDAYLGWLSNELDVIVKTLNIWMHTPVVMVFYKLNKTANQIAQHVLEN